MKSTQLCAQVGAQHGQGAGMSIQRDLLQSRTLLHQYGKARMGADSLDLGACTRYSELQQRHTVGTSLL